MVVGTEGNLARRGLRGVKLVISDAHEGLKAAITKVLGATWQRCRVHFMRNALAYAGKNRELHQLADTVITKPPGFALHVGVFCDAIGRQVDAEIHNAVQIGPVGEADADRNGEADQHANARSNAAYAPAEFREGALGMWHFHCLFCGNGAASSAMTPEAATLSMAARIACLIIVNHPQSSTGRPY
jgi:hypothetical protein